MQKVCILGGSGFVGSHLVAELSQRNISCHILSRNPQRHSRLLVNQGVTLTKADLFEEKALETNFSGCDAVINLIGILNEAGKEQTFRRYHIELADRIIEACLATGVGRLLQMSALHADEARGSSLYLRSKGEAENRMHTLGGANIAITSFRPSVIFGPGDSFFNRFADLLKLSPVIFPLACPNARFAPVYVGDVVAAFANALNDKTTYGKNFELCGPDIQTLKQLVEFTAKTIGKRHWIVGLSDGLSKLQANIFEYLPGKPFSKDNYLSLQTDSICNSNALRQLGVNPTTIASIVPLYLADAAYRGRFSGYRKLN